MSAYDVAVLALPGIEGYWPLNEAAGTVIADAKGNAGPADASGGFAGHQQASLLSPLNDDGHSFYFDGSKRLAFRDQAPFPWRGLSELSLLGWIKPNRIASTQHLIVRFLGYGSSLIGTAYGGYNWQGGSLQSLIVPQCTYLFGVSWDGQEISYSLNGVEVATHAQTGPTSASGGVSEFAGEFGTPTYQGWAQKLALCSQALTLSDIRALYELGVMTTAEVEGEQKLVMPYSRQVVAAGHREVAWLSNAGDITYWVSHGGEADVGVGTPIAPQETVPFRNYEGVLNAMHHGQLGAKPLGIRIE